MNNIKFTYPDFARRWTVFCCRVFKLVSTLVLYVLTATIAYALFTNKLDDSALREALLALSVAAAFYWFAVLQLWAAKKFLQPKQQ